MMALIPLLIPILSPSSLLNKAPIEFGLCSAPSRQTVGKDLDPAGRP